MKRTSYYLIVLVVSTILLGCGKDEKEKIETEPVVFSKEGNLKIFKSNGDLVKEIDIEISDDDYERATGLMHRESMEENQGMLFIFEDAEERFFYMKNTYIPLDIIYFDSNKTAVSFQENTKPMDETSLPSALPAQYVLEINAGLSEKWNLEIGDKIEWEVFKE